MRLQIDSIYNDYQKSEGIIQKCNSQEGVLKKNDILTKILVIVGNILLWTPLILPFVFFIAALVQRGRFLLDILMPAELFPAVFLGSLLLFWVSLRVKKRRAFIGFGAGFAALMLISAQAVASVSVIPAGETHIAGGVKLLALTMIVIFDLALVFVGVNGLKLLKDLIRESQDYNEDAL